MLELKLIAAGSSPLIAEEIKSVAQSFPGEEIFIDTATTDEIKTPPENIFCVCAVTQAEKLSRVVPADKLFVFDLHPTTKFFLDIARIPSGSEVYVFNNLLPYTKLLAEECRALGVDRLLEHVLLKNYRDDLRDDVKILAGKRAASAKAIIGQIGGNSCTEENFGTLKLSTSNFPV